MVHGRPGARNQQIVAGFARDRLDAVQQGGKEIALDVDQEQPNRVGLVGSEVARRGLGNVLEFSKAPYWGTHSPHRE